ncbi:MAG TPA: hypothetical protein VHE78_04700 [Gemmatimonadaceae bacterium]|nr:hypothetical protein [Gemmatimonadaceae bacterium]
MTFKEHDDWLSDPRVLEDIPAVIIYGPRDKKAAVVYHPLGANHDAAVRAAERLRRAGFRVRMLDTFEKVGR